MSKEETYKRTIFKTIVMGEEMFSKVLESHIAEAWEIVNTGYSEHPQYGKFWAILKRELVTTL